MIKKAKNNHLIFCVFFILGFQVSVAQIISPFNKLSINDSAKAYSFLVSGHFHGASTNYSGFPASTLLANIDTINSLQPEFIISLGDMFLDVDSSIIENYRKSLFNKLSSPLFNVVGNHDLSNGNLYGKLYGKTYFWFKKRSEIFILLDTEINDGNILDEQKIMFEEAFKEAKGEEIEHVFIFSHRPIWAENNQRYKDLFKGNTRSSFGVPNYENEIKPMLEALGKPVLWISGSMAGGPSSFFYDKYPDSNIIFMQTAIRDLPRDAVLNITVGVEGICLKAISLTGQLLYPVESYGLEFWLKNKHREEKFNLRLLPYLAMKMFLHSYFWIGFFISLFLMLAAFFVVKKWKRKK